MIFWFSHNLALKILIATALSLLIGFNSGCGYCQKTPLASGKIGSTYIAGAPNFANCEVRASIKAKKNSCYDGFAYKFPTFSFSLGSMPFPQQEELKIAEFGAELDPHQLLPYRPPEPFQSA